MENVCSAIAKVALRVASILSSRSGEVTDFPCLLECDRCGKCTLTTLTCSRRVTGHILQGLIASGHHEGMVIARERYERFQVPRSPGKELVRALQTKSLSDQTDGFQGVIGPPAVFCSETDPFRIGHFEFRKWMQILAGRWVRVFQFRREGMSCFNDCLTAFVSCRPPSAS